MNTLSRDDLDVLEDEVNRQLALCSLTSRVKANVRVLRHGTKVLLLLDYDPEIIDIPGEVSGGGNP